MYGGKKLILSIFWVILGAVLVALSVAEVLESSIYAGMGGGLFTVGIFQIIRNVKYTKDAGYREKIDTELGDERNAFLRMKSWSYAGFIAIMVECVGVIIAMILGQRTIQMVLSFSVCLILATYWISYVVLRRKY